MMDYAILLLYLIDIREQVCHTDCHHGNSAHLTDGVAGETHEQGEHRATKQAHDHQAAHLILAFGH